MASDQFAASDDHERVPPRVLLVGLAICLLFSIAAVVLRGVRWDETWEYALTMTRTTPYPEGHPMLRYTFGAYSLPNYLSAGMLWLGLGPELICGFRNVLFLFATVSPVFLIASVLARNTLYGCVAALLALEGIYLEFDGSYPLMTWPELYSNGHIGGQFALLSLGLMIAGFPAAAFFLAGLMPCIHIGQILPLFGIAASYTLCEAREGGRALLKRILPWGLVGLAVSVIFLVMQRSIFSIPAPTVGPYFSNEDAHAVWQSYTEYHDIHRQPPPGNGEVILAGMLLLCAGAAYFEMRESSGGRLSIRRRPFLVLLAYSAAVAAVVWGIMLIHSFLGANTPFILVGWMPYRLVNHISPLLLCSVVGILGARKKPEGTELTTSVLLVGALAYYLVLPFLPQVVGAPIWSRYLAKGDGLLFALYGAAIGRLTIMMWQQPLTKKTWLFVNALAVVFLAAYHQFGAACLAAGFVLTTVGSRVLSQPSRLMRRIETPSVVATLCVTLTLLMCAQQWDTRRNFPVSEFDRHISQYLRDQGRLDAMLAGPPNEFMLQARTSHPVFAEVATASYLTYMPELGPVFQKMLFDMYGLRFDRKNNGQDTPWQELWRARTRDEWKRLAREYSFQYVIAYDSMTLDLSLAFRDGPNALYRISD